MTDPKRIDRSFDCVEFKREAQRRIYEEIKDMTPSEEIEYFRRRVESGPFADLVARLGKTIDRPPRHPDRGDENL